MKFENVEPCPYKSTAHPTIDEMERLCKWFSNYDINNFLEFGCGFSTWYLYHTISANNYVTVETYPPSVSNITQHLPLVQLVGSFEDIPEKKYDFIFVDGSPGAKVAQSRYAKSRYVTVEYISINNLVEKGSILACHDYVNRKKRHSLRNNPDSIWHRTMEKYGWEVIDEIKGDMWFGIYQKS